MTYPNCAAAYKDGRSNIPQGDPAYSAKLDRDGDGVACDTPPPGFTPRPESTAGVSTPSGELAQTGAGDVAGIGVLVVAMGAVVVWAFRRRLRFTA